MIAEATTFIFGFFALIFFGTLMGVFYVIGKIFNGIFFGARGIFRGIARGIGFMTGQNVTPPGVKQCTRWNCQCLNPTDAKYCRRCGNGF